MVVGSFTISLGIWRAQAHHAQGATKVQEKIWQRPGSSGHSKHGGNSMPLVTWSVAVLGIVPTCYVTCLDSVLDSRLENCAVVM